MTLFGRYGLLVWFGLLGVCAAAEPRHYADEQPLPEQAQAREYKAGTTVELYLADSGRTICLHPGETAAVKLVGWYDAAQVWKMKPLGWFSPLQVLKPNDEITPNYARKHRGLPLVGWSPTTVFYLKAAKTGKTEVRFEHNSVGHPEPRPHTAAYTFVIRPVLR